MRLPQRKIGDGVGSLCVCFPVLAEEGLGTGLGIGNFGKQIFTAMLVVTLYTYGFCLVDCG